MLAGCSFLARSTWAAEGHGHGHAKAAGGCAGVPTGHPKLEHLRGVSGPAVLPSAERLGEAAALDGRSGKQFLGGRGRELVGWLPSGVYQGSHGREDGGRSRRRRNWAEGGSARLHGPPVPLDGGHVEGGSCHGQGPGRFAAPSVHLCRRLGSAI